MAMLRKVRRLPSVGNRSAAGGTGRGRARVKGRSAAGAEGHGRARVKRRSAARATGYETTRVKGRTARTAPVSVTAPLPAPAFTSPPALFNETTRITGHAGTPPRVSIIIPVWNERRTIAGVIRQALQVHPGNEVIVVANGTTDGSDRIAARLGAKVISVPSPLGHDVGRAIGAMQARGDILLFLDGDIIIPARELRPFVRSVEGGVDVALNQYCGPTHKPSVHSVVLAKHALNALLQRPDMAGTSMTTIPHAISRRAMTAIGPERLQVPPLAQAVAIAQGLVVKPVHLVSVGRRNPLRPRRMKGNRDPVEQLIVGDHLEAIDWLRAEADARGRLADTIRARDKVR